MLGTSQWGSPYTWRLIKKQMEKLRLQQNDVQCFNVFPFTLGSFAVIYHPDTFQNILDWLADPEFSCRPYDYVFSFLSFMGHPVRALYDPLAIVWLDHVSSVDPSRKKHNPFTRACRHR